MSWGTGIAVDEKAIGAGFLPDDGTEADEGDLVVAEGSKRVVMEPKDITIFQYKRWFDTARLSLNPDWQRAYVWRGRRPSMLIESLLMQIPIPVIFLAKTDTDSYEVIDGVQRLTTAFNFLDNKFPLTGMTVFTEYNGKTFKELPEQARSQIEDASITAFVLSEKTRQDMLFTIFERINTGGVSLNEMEIRNCIFRGPLNDRIQQLTRNKDFLEAVNMRNIGDRMLDRSLILRFLAFYEQGYEKASAGLKAFLNRFFDAHRNASDRLLDEYENRFRQAMRSAVSVFGSHAFRLRRTDRKGGGDWTPRANASIFQVVATSFARYEHHEIVQNADAVHEAYLDLLTDARWIDCVSRATGDFQNIRYAFESWNTRLDTVMSSARGLDRVRLFSQSLKEELYQQNRECAICGQHIASVKDAAVDHVEQYWLGGRTIPTNARLTHRICNMKRPRFEAQAIPDPGFALPELHAPSGPGLV